MLNVPGPVAGYDSLSIHYQFHEAQGDPSSSPVAIWHTGGPGGSSITVGLYTEMGYYQIDSDGAHVNEWAWNRVANMLYLESPAGSGRQSGFSMCYKDNKVTDCVWDDVSQAEAYAHTIAAFYKAFPEFVSNDLYLVGESYFGQYGPNIAHYILTHDEFSKYFNLKGIALGNACWGGNESFVLCNGYNADQNDVDNYFGKGLLGKTLYDQIYNTCAFPTEYSPTGPGELSQACEELLQQTGKEVGPHNIYDIYDNCPRTNELLEEEGITMRDLLLLARGEMNTQSLSQERVSAVSGGYDWSCGGEDAAAAWFLREDVQKALNLPKPGQSSFSYTRSGPASITIYPSLIGKIRVLIYNGDADDCVPYKGNVEWITDLEATGLYHEQKPWSPWYADGVKYMPAGYVTTYNVTGSQLDFSFATVRLAGHMVPTFMPNPALSLFSRFLSGEPI